MHKFVVLFLGLVFLFSAMTSHLWLFPFIHDRHLQVYADSMNSLPVPKDTRLITSENRVGQQSGNGDHCDYLSALFMDTKLTKDEIENHYNKVNVQGLDLKYLWSDEINSYVSEQNRVFAIHSLREHLVSDTMKGKFNLVVYVFATHDTGSWDYRCM